MGEQLEHCHQGTAHNAAAEGAHVHSVDSSKKWLFEGFTGCSDLTPYLELFGVLASQLHYHWTCGICRNGGLRAWICRIKNVTFE